jgi:hypothetical protein
MRRTLLSLLVMAFAAPALGQTPPPVPPIADLDRYQAFTIGTTETSDFAVPFPVFGDCSDLSVRVNGISLPQPSQWTCYSASGKQFSQIPLPITDLHVLLTTPVISSTVEIFGSWHARQIFQPTAPGITRREFNQSYSTLVAGQRELERKFADYNAFGTISLGANVTGILLPANGGTGTATPGLVAGSNVSITGTWPNQTINAVVTSTYNPPYTNSQPQTFTNKFAQRIDVADFYNPASPPTDITTAMGYALAAANTLGGAVVNFCGSFTIGSVASYSYNGVWLKGCSVNGAVLTESSTSVSPFTITASTGSNARYNTFSDFTIQSPSSQVSGAAISFVGTDSAGAVVYPVYDCAVQNVRFIGQFLAIGMKDTAFCKIDHNYIVNGTASSGRGIAITGASVADIISYNNIDSSTTPSVGIYIGGDINGEYLIGNNSAHNAFGIQVSTASANVGVRNLFFSQNSFDSNTQQGAVFVTDGNHIIDHVNMVGDWFSSNGNGGMLLYAIGTGKIGAFNIVGPTFFNNTGAGFISQGTSSTYAVNGVSISSPMATTNTTQGILFNAYSYHMSVVGGIAGASGTSGGNGTYGVQATANTDYIRISEMDTTGNSTGGVSVDGSISHSEVGAATNF